MERVSDEWLKRQLAVGAHVIGSVTLLEVDIDMYKNMVAELLESRKAEKEQDNKDHSKEQKGGAEAEQERERAIYRFWQKLGVTQAARPCRECPAWKPLSNICSSVIKENVGITCGNALRAKYEELSADKDKAAILPIPCTKGFENWTVKQWFQKINEELDELKEVVLRWSDLNDIVLESDYVGESNNIELAEEAADTITAITSMLEAMGIDEGMRQAAQKRVNERNRERGRLK